MPRTAPKSLPELDYAKASRKIESFIAKIARGKNVIVGLSGGIDSSVVAALCTRSLGDEKVIGLVMPSGSTPADDRADAMNLAHSLGIETAVFNVDPALALFSQQLPDFSDKKVVGNLTSRTRMSVLYYFAGARNGLVAGTSDRSEFLIGYFTKYGDGGADLQPILSLYKSQVRMLGTYLMIPAQILEKKSSPRLWDNQLAEEELGIDYSTIDSVLHLSIDNKFSDKRIAAQLKVSNEVIAKIKDMVASSAHKRKMPPYPRL